VFQFVILRRKTPEARYENQMLGIKRGGDFMTLCICQNPYIHTQQSIYCSYFYQQLGENINLDLSSSKKEIRLNISEFKNKTNEIVKSERTINTTENQINRFNIKLDTVEKTSDPKGGYKKIHNKS